MSLGIISLWLGINSFLIVVLGVLVLVTLRQVGILLNSVGPVGARETNQGPRIGENIAYQLKSHLDHKITQPSLLVFGSKSCAVCEVIKSAGRKLAHYWSKKVSFLYVYDDEKGVDDEGKGILFFLSSELRDSLDVRMLPFALAVDQNGVVRAQGLVNDISNLEMLLEKMETLDEEKNEAAF